VKKHKKSHGVKHRSATQKNETTAKSYCTEHGQNPTHPTDKSYTLKNRAEGKKILEMFAVVLQQEHKKIAAKTPKKAQKTRIVNESSDRTTKTCL
jgi:hypothetical protein